MKKWVYITFFCLFTILLTAQEIHWVSFGEALEMQKRVPKKIMIDMYTNWCGPCKMLDRNTFSNPDVIEYINTHFYAVKFNAEGNEKITINGQELTNPNYNPERAYRRNSQHQFAAYYGVRSYPTIVYLDEKGGFIAPVPGYRSPQQIELYLKLFVSDAYKQMTSQQAFNAYYKNFKPQFKPQ